jgi:hypothetical protein
MSLFMTSECRPSLGFKAILQEISRPEYLRDAEQITKMNAKKMNTLDIIK